MPDVIAQFERTKYLNLETFRKTGVGVCTPVWFAQDVCHSSPAQTLFYVYAEADSGKIKRLRNNPKVRIAPCTMRGNLAGAWVDAHAYICQGEQVAHAQDLLRKKYGWLKKSGDFIGRLMRHRQAVIAIEVA